MSTPHFSIDPAQRVGKRILRIPSTLLRAGLPALALIVVLAACDSNGGEDFNISTYSGEAYSGNAEGAVIHPGGEANVFFTSTASAQIDSLSESEARLSLTFGTLGAFEAEGTYDANGASFTDGEDFVEIDGSGTFHGDLEIFGYQTELRGDVSGQATSTSFDLETRTVLTDDVGDDPADTEVRFVFELNR